ncbi:uncharacterized protein IL334_004926 [Kwoniella shivajii]|uniref:Mutanase n=1 Tax=Kwoniella shivajii TaxID=564305 RepID=A0ABZ1D2X5_9TREE|nr:hypothetical protein IL334_004926 [Kwoniella shivajii]
MKFAIAIGLLQLLPSAFGKHGDSFQRRSRHNNHEGLAERQVIETIYETETVWVDASPTQTATGAETPITVAALAAETVSEQLSDSQATTTTTSSQGVQTATGIYGLSQATNPIDTFVSSASSSDDLVSSTTAYTADVSSTSASLGISVNVSAGINSTSDSDSVEVKAASFDGSWGNLGGGGQQSSTGSNDKKVFAHFMIGIVHGYVLNDWLDDIALAKSKGIDGFALNIGLDWYSQDQLDLAYEAAKQSGDFVCFISFDFNWYTTTNVTGVAEMMKRYNNLPAQLRVDGKPFVSTFIGDGFDWSAVAKEVGEEIYAVPFWAPTQENANNAGLSGLFSWTAWASKDNKPINEPLTTVQDEAYLDVVGKANKVYMAPVSSWFFTHFGKEVPWSKNWLFRSENLWKYRWDQLLQMGDNLKFIEIVTWNDYGESHNVRPWGGNHTDDGSSKWSEGLDHSAMLDLSLPYIKAWKAGKKSPVIEKDQLFYWYRPHLKSANCDDTDNFGSKPEGWEFVADTVFVTTMTKLGGTVKITSGSNAPVFKIVKPGVQSIEIPMGVGEQKFEFLTLTSGWKKGVSTVDISDKCWPTKEFAGIYNYNYHSGVLDC